MRTRSRLDRKDESALQPEVGTREKKVRSWGGETAAGCCRGCGGRNDRQIRFTPSTSSCAVSAITRVAHKVRLVHVVGRYRSREGAGRMAWEIVTDTRRLVEFSMFASREVVGRYTMMPELRVYRMPLSRGVDCVVRLMGDGGGDGDSDLVVARLLNEGATANLRSKGREDSRKDKK
ncbi:hypothetical protein LY78DRAFT_100737 [Colletotrichum sublineola]|nr:hypothetical protein LY78DRAFT_100737 [Colletotrichum sublineola]